MTKQDREMILKDFEKIKDRLPIPENWYANTCVMPFLTSQGVPVSVRYGFKEKKFIEINVISEDNKLEYIKL